MNKWIGTGTGAKHKSVYHTDRDCYLIKTEPRKVGEQEIEFHDLTECQRCADEWEHGPADFDLYNAVVEAGKQNSD